MMNSPVSEVIINQYRQGWDGTVETSERQISPGTDSDVPDRTLITAGSLYEVSVSGILPHPHQQTVPSEMLYPANFRFHCPCQSAQCQLTCPEYIVELQSSQYHVLTGPVPGPSDGQHHSSVSASWFSEEPILSNMVADLHKPVAMDPQQFQEGVAHNASGDGQEIFLHPCNMSSVFHTMESAPTHGDGGTTPGKGVTELVTDLQFPQDHTVCSLHECRAQTANVQPPGSIHRSVEASCEQRSRKACHCTRSQCLKLYCECFANGMMCSSCNCSNCHNNTKHNDEREKAIKLCLDRNPNAFRPKIAGGRSGAAQGRHNRGCNCKRSHCLKNYCECYEANIMCTSSCNCVGCRNYDDRSQTAVKEETGRVKSRCPTAVITPAVVETVCCCLLAKAEEAERAARAPAVAEHLVLDEFGLCLSQIILAMFGSAPQ
ncbi:spexin prohormone 2 isoform X1 [Melanotaenia boesemani]|uniref:spexin prohormone 2 isoform X1 n=1 Tax=Melanotaenia boesemani TaxID=1250792 RepID=UPI001C040DEB|nr:spexin prohormone 2 isoform X1 [Melanotaenia boesemani]